MSTAGSDTQTVRLTPTHNRGYGLRAVVQGGDPKGFLIDEDPPLGSSSGPSPLALVAAAVGSCLTSSLRFCLAKSRVEPTQLNTSAVATIQRNSQGRLRITNIAVEIRPAVAADMKPRFERCEKLFEEFCTVTQSIRQGIPVEIIIAPEFGLDSSHEGAA